MAMTLQEMLDEINLHITNNNTRSITGAGLNQVLQDLATFANQGGGGGSITGPASRIPYFGFDGNATNDSGFKRDPATTFTNIKSNFTTANGPTTGGFEMGEISEIFGLPGSAIFQNDQYITSGLGIVDASVFGGSANLPIMIMTEQSTGAQGLVIINPTSMQGSLSVQMQADDGANNRGQVDATADGRAGISGKVGGHSSSIFSNGLQAGWDIDGSTVYLPVTSGSPGQVLMLGAGNTTSWQTVSGSSMLSDTYANWMTARANGTLPAGQFIYISDRFNGAVFYCPSASDLAIEGAARFVNADYQVSGDYSQVQANTGVAVGSKHGQWIQSSDGSYLQGDIVIYNCEHYQVTNEPMKSGGNPVGNPGYTALSTAPMFGNAATVGYIYEWDTIIYNFNADKIIWRMDRRGNKINYDSLNYFQWGDDRVHHVTMGSSTSYVNTLNNSGSSISGDIHGENTQAYLSENSGIIFFSIDGTNIQCNTQVNSGIIEMHVEGYSAGVQAYANGGFIRVYVSDSSVISAPNNTGIANRYSDQSATNHDNNAGVISACEFRGMFGGLVSTQLGVTYQSCVFSGVNGSYYTFPSDTSYSYKEIGPSGSTFDTTLNITGLSYIDATNLAPFGVIKLTSDNASETLIAASNPVTSFPQKFTPADGLTVTITTTNVAVPAASAIYSGGLGFNLVGRPIPAMSDYMVAQGFNESGINGYVVREAVIY